MIWAHKRQCCCPPEEPNACDCTLPVAETSFSPNCQAPPFGCIATTYSVELAAQGSVGCESCGLSEGSNSSDAGTVTCCLTHCSDNGAFPCSKYRGVQPSPFTNNSFHAWYGECDNASYVLRSYFPSTTCTGTPVVATSIKLRFYLYIANSATSLNRAFLAVDSIQVGNVFQSSYATTKTINPCERFELPNAGTLCNTGPLNESSNFPGGTATVTPCCPEEDI